MKQKRDGTFELQPVIRFALPEVPPSSTGAAAGA
jgi:hypothetical protein